MPELEIVQILDLYYIRKVIRYTKRNGWLPWSKSVEKIRYEYLKYGLFEGSYNEDIDWRSEATKGYTSLEDAKVKVKMIQDYYIMQDPEGHIKVIWTNNGADKIREDERKMLEVTREMILAHNRGDDVMHEKYAQELFKLQESKKD